MTTNSPAPEGAARATDEAIAKSNVFQRAMSAYTTAQYYVEHAPDAQLTEKIAQRDVAVVALVSAIRASLGGEPTPPSDDTLAKVVTDHSALLNLLSKVRMALGDSLGVAQEIDAEFLRQGLPLPYAPPDAWQVLNAHGAVVGTFAERTDAEDDRREWEINATSAKPHTLRALYAAPLSGESREAVRLLRQLIEVYDGNHLRMESEEVDGEGQAGPPYQWHEEWLHQARRAVSEKE